MCPIAFVHFSFHYFHPFDSILKQNHRQVIFRCCNPVSESTQRSWLLQRECGDRCERLCLFRLQGQRCAKRRQDELRWVCLVPLIWGRQEKPNQVLSSCSDIRDSPSVLQVCSHPQKLKHRQPVSHLPRQHRVLVSLHGRRWRRRSLHVWAGILLWGAVWEDGEDGHRTAALPGFALPNAWLGQARESRLNIFNFLHLRVTHWFCARIKHMNAFAPGKITLSDLKRCRMAHIFFDTFFNLEKYLDHEQRDPFAVQKVPTFISYM